MLSWAIPMSLWKLPQTSTKLCIIHALSCSLTVSFCNIFTVCIPPSQGEDAREARNWCGWWTRASSLVHAWKSNGPSAFFLPDCPRWKPQFVEQLRLFALEAGTRVVSTFACKVQNYINDVHSVPQKGDLIKKIKGELYPLSKDYWSFLEKAGRKSESFNILQSCIWESSFCLHLCLCCKHTHCTIRQAMEIGIGKNLEKYLIA